MPYEEVCFQRMKQDNPEDYEELKLEKKPDIYTANL